MTQGFFPNVAGHVTPEYILEVARGNVDGAYIRTIIGRNPSTANSDRVIWHGNTPTYDWPTAAETWEIVSDSPDDTSGGAGANAVLINYLDVDYNPQTVIVELAGTAPVLLNANHFRADGATVVASGATRKNVGIITIRVAGGGAARQYIPPEFSISQDSIYTIPAGKQGISLRDVFSFPTDGGFGAGVLIPFGTNTEITTGEFALTGNIMFDLTGQFIAPEKTDVFFKARSQNPGKKISTVLVFLIEDAPSG